MNNRMSVRLHLTQGCEDRQNDHSEGRDEYHTHDREDSRN